MTFFARIHSLTINNATFIILTKNRMGERGDYPTALGPEKVTGQ